MNMKLKIEGLNDPRMHPRARLLFLGGGAAIALLLAVLAVVYLRGMGQRGIAENIYYLALAIWVPMSFALERLSRSPLWDRFGGGGLSRPKREALLTGSSLGMILGILALSVQAQPGHTGPALWIYVELLVALMAVQVVFALLVVLIGRSWQTAILRSLGL